MTDGDGAGAPPTTKATGDQERCFETLLQNIFGYSRDEIEQIDDTLDDDEDDVVQRLNDEDDAEKTHDDTLDDDEDDDVPFVLLKDDEDDAEKTHDDTLDDDEDDDVPFVLLKDDEDEDRYGSIRVFGSISMHLRIALGVLLRYQQDRSKRTLLGHHNVDQGFGKVCVVLRR